MLSGQCAFQGATPADTMSAILKEDPPELTETGLQIPLALEGIVRHRLEKNPQRRFQSAQDLAFNLEQLSQSSGSHTSLAATPAVKQRHGLWSLLAALGVVAVAATAFIAGQYAGHAAKPNFHQLTFQRGRVLQARFSPDGKTIIYSAAWNGKPRDVYSTRADRPGARSLDLKGGRVLALSTAGDLAILMKATTSQTFSDTGTLAIVLAGSAHSPVQLFLFPTGTGEPRWLTNDHIDHSSLCMAARRQAHRVFGFGAGTSGAHICTGPGKRFPEGNFPGRI
jgi:eukaryotic-like serine/threonine-protein kinase